MLTMATNAQTSCCNAAFSSYTLPQSNGLNVFQFTMYDSTASDIQSVQWAFGDNSYSNSTAPQHVYNYTGEYSVTLTVFKQMADGVQKSCSEIHVLLVTGTCSNFIYSKSNREVSFFQTATFDIDSASAWATSRAFLWTFGDGQISNELNPTHTYLQEGSYTACLYQYTTDSASADSCYTCHSFIVQDTTQSVICQSDFSYSLTDTLLSLNANSLIGTSYWWIEGDTNSSAWGNSVYLATPPQDSFTVCHRQYTDSIVGSNSQYCTECNSIQPVNQDSVFACNADFTYALTDSTILVEAFSSTGISSWNYLVNGLNAGITYNGDHLEMFLPENGDITICHFQYNNSVSDSCIICKVVREQQDTIPEVCYSDFLYNVNGLTITAYVDSFNYSKNVWNFANESFVYDTLFASHTFDGPGMKRICQTSFLTGASDSCTTCKDVFIEAADISIHPNPAVYQITVKSKDGFISSIDIHDINGMNVKSISNLRVIKYNVNVSDLTSGIYYVSTILEDGRMNRSKIIIQ